MAISEKIVFLSPSDFQLGDVGFKAGLYQVQQLDEDQQHILVFTRIASIASEFAPKQWMAELAMGARDDDSDC